MSGDERDLAMAMTLAQLATEMEDGRLPLARLLEALETQYKLRFRSPLELSEFLSGEAGLTCRGEALVCNKRLNEFVACQLGTEWLAAVTGGAVGRLMGDGQGQVPAEGPMDGGGFKDFAPSQAAPLPAVRISEGQCLRFTREAEVALGMPQVISCSLAYSRAVHAIRITLNKAYRADALPLRRNGTLYLDAQRFVASNGIVERGEFVLREVGPGVYEADLREAGRG